MLGTGGGGVGGRVRKPTIAPRNGKPALTAGCRRSVPLCVKDTLLALSISLLREAAGIWGNTHSCSWEPSLKQEDIKGSAERETQTQRMGWVLVSLQRGLERHPSASRKKPQGIWNQWEIAQPSYRLFPVSRWRWRNTNQHLPCSNCWFPLKSVLPLLIIIANID